MSRWFCNMGILLCLPIASLLHGQESQELTLLGNYNPLNPVENTTSFFYNEVWGYHDDHGEYAILGSRDSIFFIDVTDPTSPTRIDAFAGGVSISWRDFKTYGHYAFAGSEGAGEGLIVFDLQYLPDSVVKVYQSDTIFNRSHNIFVDTASAVLYAAGARKIGLGSRDLIAVNISNPAHPVELFHTNLPSGRYIHDLYAAQDTLYCNHGSFNTSANELLVYECDENGCQEIGGIYAYSQEGYNHSCWLTEDRKKIVWADESFNTSLKIANISIDPSAMPSERVELELTDLFRSKLLESETGDTGSIAHNPLIKGDSVYISYYHDGVSVWNIENPDSVYKVAYYDTYPFNTNYSAYKGCWGVYPFLPSGTILASDISRGLFLLSFPVDTTIASDPCDSASLQGSESVINTWIGPEDGQWLGMPEYWSLGIFPQPCHEVHIPDSASVILQSPTPIDIFRLVVEYGGQLFVEEGTELTTQFEE